LPTFLPLGDVVLPLRDPTPELLGLWVSPVHGAAAAGRLEGGQALGAAVAAERGEGGRKIAAWSLALTTPTTLVNFS
jgi:hypothetical protein